jgi:hypothetical protein
MPAAGGEASRCVPSLQQDPDAEIRAVLDAATARS